MHILRQLVLFPLIFCLPLWVAAEQVYINDTLRVGVRPSPSSSSAPIAVVTTGMRLQVVDRVDGYLKIRGDDDIEGWIKDIYVVADAPSVIKLHQLQKKYAVAMDKVKHLQSDLQVATEATQMLSEQLESQKMDTSKLQQELARKVGLQRLEETQHSLMWWIGLFVIPILCFAGFYSGIVWYRNQTMKRLGGLRV
jgi:SH3 domain protein